MIPTGGVVALLFKCIDMAMEEERQRQRGVERR